MDWPYRAGVSSTKLNLGDSMSSAQAAHLSTAPRMGRVAWLVFVLGLGACGQPATPTAPVTPPALGVPNQAPSLDIAFVSSTPAVGSTIVTGADPNGLPPEFLGGDVLVLTFTVQSATATPVGQLRLELFDASGKRCGFISTAKYALPAGVPVTISTSPGTPGLWLWSCAVPTTTTTVTATLVGLPYSPFPSKSLPLAFSYQPYAPLPAGLPPTPPTIATLGWSDSTMSPCDGYCHSPGDTIVVYCGVAESDGASLTATLTMTWDDGTQETKSVAFPPGASSLPSHSIPTPGPTPPVIGAVIAIYPTVRAGVNGAPPHATAVCSAVNVRGETATRTIGFPK